MEGAGLAGPVSSGTIVGQFKKRITPKELKAKMRLAYATPAGPVTITAKKKRRKSKLVGKMSPMMVRQEGWGAQGPQRTPAIPDFGSLYYTPETPESRAREQEASLNRRRSMGANNAKKFGFHGTSLPKDEPELRFVVRKDNLHGPTVGQRTPVVRAPKLLSSWDGKRAKLAQRR
jgi:hypothetical protein